LLETLQKCVAAGRSGTYATIVIPEQRERPARGHVGPEELAVSGSAELQIEAIQLASNFILRSRLSNPKVLSRAETPAALAGHGAAWKSDEAVGAVRIVPAEAKMKGIDVAAALAAEDSKACKGKIASGRISELIDSDVVFRGYSHCEDSSGSRISQHFIVPRRVGGFAVFTVISTGEDETSRGVTREERLSDFRKAALTAGGD
jgi:hypothetical protein